jgi:hypothetical protein
VLRRREITQRLMRALGVVKADPGLDGGLGLFKRLEVVLPYALLLERAKEALAHPVLLWGVRRDELLAQTVLFAARLEMLGSEHLAVVASQLGALLSARIDQPVTRQAGLLQRLHGLLRSASMAHTQADDLSIVAVNHRCDPDSTILLPICAYHTNLIQ